MIHALGGEKDEGRTMSENNQAPTPEEMGAKLDEEIKETVQDWVSWTRRSRKPYRTGSTIRRPPILTIWTIAST